MLVLLMSMNHHSGEHVCDSGECSLMWLARPLFGDRVHDFGEHYHNCAGVFLIVVCMIIVVWGVVINVICTITILVIMFLILVIILIFVAGMFLILVSMSMIVKACS
jgi:hypothetical protein